MISRVHQEHPGLRPRRRALLAGPHARGGRGRPVHRPAPGDPRLARTSAWPTRWPCVVADAAARAVEFVGLPEAQLNLAQAVVHLATAPKSNRVTVAIGRARSDVRERRRRRGAAAPARRPLPGGEDPRPRAGLRVPSRRPSGWVAQQYRPAEARGPGLLRAVVARGGGQGAPAHGTASGAGPGRPVPSRTVTGERRRRGADRGRHRRARRGGHGGAVAHLHPAVAARDRRRPPPRDPARHRRAAGHGGHAPTASWPGSTTCSTPPRRSGPGSRPRPG